MRLAIAVTFVLAVIVTWPMPVAPVSTMLGHAGNDVWNHVWGFWWVAEELSTGRIPLRTDLMSFPENRRLFFIDSFGAVMTLPIQWLFGPVAAYNGAVFAAFWTAGLGAWALCRHTLQSLVSDPEDRDRLALFAAVAYTFSPHLIGQGYNGISETLNAAGLPFATLAALRLYERPSLGRGLAAGGVGAVCLLANWYYGLFAVLAAALLLGAAALGTRERIHWRALVVPATLGALVAAILIGPVLSAFAWTLDGADAIVSRDPEFVWRQLVSHNVTDAISVFRPGKVYSPDLKALHGEDLVIVVYAGWVLLATATLGLLRLRRWRDRGPWVAWTLFFGIMMLGPYLFWDGDHVMVDHRKLPLPFLFLFDVVPLFARISHPFRFVVAVQLGLAMLGAAGLTLLPRRWRAVPALLLTVECLLLSPAPWPVPVATAALPASNQVLRDDPSPGAVLDLPATVPNLERAVYLYWQTGHGRPSPYTLNEPMPAVLARSHLLKLLLIGESGRVDRLPPMLPELDLIIAGRSLARLGFRFVVLHERLYPPGRLETALTLLRVALGPETVVSEEQQHIWRLPELTE